jgi:hypothetical protein
VLDLGISKRANSYEPRENSREKPQQRKLDQPEIKDMKISEDKDKLYISMIECLCTFKFVTV